MRQDILEHIEKSIVIDTNQCWVWQLAKKKPPSLPYGMMCVNEKMYRVHVLMYTLTVGEVPTGQKVLHSCDNASCCNPTHLFLGTQNDNMQDRRNKGRAPKGEEHANSKLTEAQAIEILSRVSKGARHEILIEEFKISKWALRDLIEGRRWSHLPRPEPIDILW